MKINFHDFCIRRRIRHGSHFAEKLCLVSNSFWHIVFSISSSEVGTDVTLDVTFDIKA